MSEEVEQTLEEKDVEVSKARSFKHEFLNFDYTHTFKHIQSLEFIQVNKKALRVKLSEEVYDEKIPPHCSLLVVSNLYGFFVAATNEGS